jgi:Xaa-Pro aminopeptidase
MKTTPSQPPEPYSLRINKLREEMARRKLDGYFVQERMDQYWLTGFTGEDGGALVTQKAVVLLTDGRFDEAADREAPYAKKILRKKRDAETNAKEVKRLKITKLGFNPGHMCVGDHNELKKFVAPAKLVPADNMITPFRGVKDGGEVDRLRTAIRVAEQAFEKVRGWLRPGLTEREIAAQLAYEMQKLGAQGETFPSIVAVGPNSSLPHYEPGDRPLTENEILLVDWGARVNWYGSDLTRVLWLGSIAPELRKVFDIVREAHDRATEAVRPGIKAHDVDRVAREVIRKAGYGERFNHALGHGLGLVAHEIPRVGKGTKTKLEPGMVITIEPGIYLPGLGGVRLEDDVLVTDTGYEVLSALPVQLS